MTKINMSCFFCFFFFHRTNLPKEVMGFPDMPFDPSPQSFISHEDVLGYLEKYAAKFNLLKYIKVCMKLILV